MLPDFADRDALIPLLVLPLAVQWWSVWYPGSEPGGGGYVAQRMLSARTERDAMTATLLFNAAHYALRSWPWIIVALASLIVFPTLDSLRDAFPNLPAGILGHDLAYPAMLTLLPAGLLGMVIASLAAAYMSTISTHLNWGSSYVVNDFWRRFVDPAASERGLVVSESQHRLLPVLRRLRGRAFFSRRDRLEILNQNPPKQRGRFGDVRCRHLVLFELRQKLAGFAHHLVQELLARLRISRSHPDLSSSCPRPR